jgi:hypothetical protein
MNARRASSVLAAILYTAGTTACVAAPREDAPAGGANKAWREKAVQFILEIEDEALRSDVSYEAVYVLARAGDLAPAREAVNRVTAPQKRIYAFTRVAEGYRKAGSTEAGLAALDQCWASLDEGQRPDWIDYMARAYAQAGYIEEARELAATMKPQWKQGRVLRDIGRIVAQNGDLDRARALVDAQGTHEHIQDGLARMVASLASSQKTDDALAAAKDLETTEDSDGAFQNLVEELVRTKRYAEAEKAAARIASPAARQGLEGKIEAAKIAGEDAAAIEKRIAATGTREEKLPLYEPLVKRLTADGKTAQVEAAIESMVAVVNASPREPTISAFGKFGDDLAIASAKALHLEIAKALAKGGDDAEARKQLAKASEAILHAPDEAGVSKTMLLMALVAAHIEVGELEMARHLVERLPENHSRTMASTALARALAKTGDIAGAVTVAKLITIEAGRGHSVGRITGDVIRAGDVDAAKSLLAGLGESAEDVQGYRDAGEAMIDTGLADDLDTWLPKMPSAAAQAYACLGAAEKRVGPEKRLAPRR